MIQDKNRHSSDEVKNSAREWEEEALGATIRKGKDKVMSNEQIPSL